MYNKVNKISSRNIGVIFSSNVIFPYFNLRPIWFLNSKLKCPDISWLQLEFDTRRNESMLPAQNEGEVIAGKWLLTECFFGIGNSDLSSDSILSMISVRLIFWVEVFVTDKVYADIFTPVCCFFIIIIIYSKRMFITFGIYKIMLQEVI